MEKIELIHRYGSVYYHYQFKYLSKLTKTRKRVCVDKAEESRFAAAGDRGPGRYLANAGLVCRKNATAPRPADEANATAAQPFLPKLLLNHI